MIEISEEIRQLSVTAGFADVNQFINNFLDKEREPQAMQAGIDARDAGRVTEFIAFDAEFRCNNGLETPYSMFKVFITDLAQSEIQQAFDGWAENRSRSQAIKWYVQLPLQSRH